MREGGSLWGWVGVAAAEGVVASKGGSLEEVEVQQRLIRFPKKKKIFGRYRTLRVETHGKKLQAEDGRLATRVKISEMRRCCTLVSWLVRQHWLRKKCHGFEPWLE